MMFSLSLTADDVGCDLPVTEPVSFHGHTTVSVTETEVAFVCLGHSTTAHCDTLIPCALEIFLLTYLLTYMKHYGRPVCFAHVLSFFF